MADDPPPWGEPEFAAVPQRKVIGDAAMPSLEDCTCEPDEPTMPLAVASMTIRARSVHPDTLLAFRRDVEAIACEYHGVVPYAALYEKLWNYAYLRKWGQGYDLTLAEDVAAEVCRTFGLNGSQELPRILDVVFSLVDQGAGRLLPELVAYDPMAARDPSRPPTMRSFVKERAGKRLVRALKADVRHLPVDEVGTTEDGDRGGALTRAEDIRRVAEPRSGESEVMVALIHKAIHEGGDLLAEGSGAELEILELLAEVLAEFRGTAFRKANLSKALTAIRRALLGEAGYCLVLDCRIGALSDSEPLNIATQISATIAREVYGSSNSTVLTGQFATWVDALIALACQDATRAARLRELVGKALESRALAHSLLLALTDILTTLDNAIADEVVALWQGRAARDRTDTANGRCGVGGVGIGQIPFLFGLLNPLADNANGLAQLIAENGDA